MTNIKDIVSEFNKKLTTRQASRKAQNERRKLQRKLAKELSSELDTKVSWKEATQIYEGSKVESKIAKELYGDIEKLKAQKIEGTNIRKGYGVELNEFSQRVKFKYPDSNTYRKNEMFKNKINQASAKDEEGNKLSGLNSMEVHGFYAATYEMWKGTSIEQNRNLDIMESFGINDLETVYKLLVNKDLKKEDFGFNDDELFEQWLKEIDSRVNLYELRKMYDEEMKGIRDVPEVKYKKDTVANIKIRTSGIKRYKRRRHASK